MHAPFHHRQALLATLITTFVHVAVAEDAKLPAISVTAPPLVESQTLNASTIDKEELRSLTPATSDTASLLRNVPGLSLQGSGGVSSLPVIRGLADDRLRIKVDGMDLISACANHMNPPLSYIDPTNVGSATVFAGITPVSIGGDSIGGTILMDSAAPEFAGAGEGLLTSGELGGFYRSNGDARGGNVAATVAGEQLSLSYQGSTTRANNYEAGDDFKPEGPAAAGRGWLDGDEVGSSQYKSTNQSVTLGLRNENHLVDLKYGEQDIPYQGWPNQRMDMTDNDSSQVNLGYKGQYDWGDLDARVYNEHTRHKMQFDDDKLYWYSYTPALDGVPCTPAPRDPNMPPTSGCAAGMPMDTRGNNVGVTVKADIPLSARDLLRVGAEAQQYDLDDWWDPSGMVMWPDTFWNINDGERDRVALFGEWEAEWSPEWLTQLGIRGERVDMDAGDVQPYSMMFRGADAAAFNAADRDETDNNIDLTALARFTPNAMNTIEFGYARKTRSPNLYERYAWSRHGMAMRMNNTAGDGNGYVGNLDLDPEVAHTVSATLDWHDVTQAKWGLQVTPYYTYIDDYIDAARCSGDSGMGAVCTTANLTATDDFVYLEFVNQDARIYGIDVSGYYPLAENTPYGSFTATGILNYVRGENDDTDDDLYNIKPLNAKLAVEHRLNNWTSTLELELVDEKTKVSQVRNELETSGYGLVHLRSSYEWKQVRFDIGVENLFDKFYDDPLGGAYLGQGKTMTGTGVPWGVAVPGMGRSVYTGLSFMF
jgi:iron complex outermembrane receptor protein